MRPDISRINFSYALSESLFELGAGLLGPIEADRGANLGFLAGATPPGRRNAVGTNDVVPAMFMLEMYSMLVWKSSTSTQNVLNINLWFGVEGRM